MPSNRMRAKSSKRRKRRPKRTYETAASQTLISSRRIARPWAFARGKVTSLLLLAALVSLIYYFFNSHYFFVHEIKVVGNRFVPAEEIGQKSGLENVNIFWIDPAHAEAALTSLSAIKEAKVRCRLPGEVTIEVGERQPRLIWRRGEARYWVDDEGIVMPAWGELEGLLLVEDDGSDFSGQRLDPAAVQSALQLKSLLPELTEVQYSSEIGISFRNRHNWLIYLGTGGDMAEKVAIMRALTSHLLAENIQPELIDLRYKRPYYK